MISDRLLAGKPGGAGGDGGIGGGGMGPWPGCDGAKGGGGAGGAGGKLVLRMGGTVWVTLSTQVVLTGGKGGGGGNAGQPGPDGSLDYAYLANPGALGATCAQRPRAPNPSPANRSLPAAFARSPTAPPTATASSAKLRPASVPLWSPLA